MIAGYAGRLSGSKDTEQRKRAKSTPVQTEKRAQKKVAKQQAAVAQRRSVNNERLAGFVGRMVQVSSARQSIHADTCAFAGGGENGPRQVQLCAMPARPEFGLVGVRLRTEAPPRVRHQRGLRADALALRQLRRDPAR